MILDSHNQFFTNLNSLSVASNRSRDSQATRRLAAVVRNEQSLVVGGAAGGDRACSQTAAGLRDGKAVVVQRSGIDKHNAPVTGQRNLIGK